MKDAIQFDMGFHCTSDLHYMHHVIVYFQTSNLKWFKIGVNIYIFGLNVFLHLRNKRGCFSEGKCSHCNDSTTCYGNSPVIGPVNFLTLPACLILLLANISYP